MIITLCGSARFESYFKVWNEALSLAGHVVFSLAAYPSDKAGLKTWYTEAQKDKIAASDAVLILNVFGYVGESTISEIEFAKKHKKPIHALESWGKGNGIGSEHYDAVQESCYRIIPEYKGSPIDSHKMLNVWDLLPPSSPERYAIVNLVHEHDNMVKGMPKEYR
jgi:hypothetical protein